MVEKSLEELANIEFPVPLSRFKSVHLLGEIGKMGNYKIELVGEFTGRLQNGKRDIYTTKIHGMIWTEDLTSTYFNLVRGLGDDYKKFDALGLSSIGRNYDEIESDEAKMWVDINHYVLEAFNIKPLKS